MTNLKYLKWSWSSSKTDIYINIYEYHSLQAQARTDYWACFYRSFTLTTTITFVSSFTFLFSFIISLSALLYAKFGFCFYALFSFSLKWVYVTSIFAFVYLYFYLGNGSVIVMYWHCVRLPSSSSELSSIEWYNKQ